MPTWNFVKKAGAPAGAIHLSIGGDSFLIDDGANSTITTTDFGVASELSSHFWLQQQGGSGTVPSSPVIEQVLLVDGVLSKPAPNGTYAPVTGDGATSLKVVNNLSDVADADTSRANLKVPALRHAQCVATSNQSIGAGALPTIDGYAVQENDRVLLAAQTTGSQNGMWIAHAAGWARPNDYPGGVALTSRSCKVTGGTVYGGTDWLLVSTSSITIDTTSTVWAPVKIPKITQVPVALEPYNVLRFGAVGDGVTDDTTAIQNAINAASASAGATAGSAVNVVFPAGYNFYTQQLHAKPGVRLWAYGSVITCKYTTFSKAFITYLTTDGPQVLSRFDIFGGSWIGSGLETSTHQNYMFAPDSGTGCQDVTIRDTYLTNWGFTAFYPRNPTRVKVLFNTIICNEVNNFGYNNTISLDYDGTAPASGRILIKGNLIHNSAADSICVLTNSNTLSGPLYSEISHNIVTADPPTADTACTFAAGTGSGNSYTVVVSSANATSAAVGRFVTAAAGGGGITAPMFVASVVPGVSYTLGTQSNGTSSIPNGSAGTLYWGIHKSTICYEFDQGTSAGFSDFSILDNIVTGYDRELVGILAQTFPISRAKIERNICNNLQVGAFWTSAKPQGSCINLHGSASQHWDVDVVGNKCTQASPGIVAIVNQVHLNGSQRNNRVSQGPIQGTAQLAAGTVSVPTTEIQAGDPVLLTVVLPGGTRGMVQLGAITAGTLQVIATSGSTAVTLAAGNIAVPANGTVLDVSGPGIPVNATLTVNSATTGTLSAAAGTTATGDSQPMPVGAFAINSVQPGTASTLQTSDTSKVFWEIVH